MRFKTWLEIRRFDDPDSIAEKIFARRDQNRNLDFNLILNKLELPETNETPNRVGSGSMATVYFNPFNKNQVIKVTGDMQDAKNFNKLIKSNFQSPNVVRCHKVVKINSQAAAMILDYVIGNEMEYSSGEFMALLNGDNFQDYREAIRNLSRGKIGQLRAEIMDKHQKDYNEEVPKLISLFKTLMSMEKIGIEMYDFAENIIDDGENYVIIDLGQ